MARILVIDDVRLMRNLIAETVQAAGHEVMCAANGKEGLKMFSAEAADLVITDLIMPEKEGLETIQQLRSAQPDLKIIAMSGAPRQLMVLEMAAMVGAQKTLQKPFQMDELTEAVETLLKAQAP